MNLEKSTLFKEGAKTGVLFMLCITLGIFSGQLIFQPKLISSALAPVLSETVGTLKDVRSSMNTIKTLTGEIKTDYENNQENVAANSEAVASTLYELNGMVKDTRTQLFGGRWNCKDSGRKTPAGNKVFDCDQIPGLFPQTSGLIADSNALVNQLNSDTHALMVEATTVLSSTDAALKPLQADLEKLGQLEDTLREDLVAGGKHGDAIAKEIEAVLDHADLLLQDPDITAIIANLNKTTYHAGEVVETLDISTQPLRKAVGRVKWILSTLSNYLKGTIRIY